MEVGKEIKGITRSVLEHGSEGEQINSGHSRISGILERTGTGAGEMEKVKDTSKGPESTEASGVTSTIDSEVG